MILFGSRFKPVVERMARFDSAPAALAFVGNSAAPNMQAHMAFVSNS